MATQRQDDSDPQEGGTDLAGWIKGLSAVMVLVLLLGSSAWIATHCLVAVDQGEVAILIRKSGLDLPPGEIAAPSVDYKGIQKEVLLEGWHFLNPFTWEAIVKPQLDVPSGQVGIKVRQFGASITAEQVLAGADSAAAPDKGIEQVVLKPGRYAINTLLYRVDLHPAVSIPPGFVGIVTRVTGKDPVDPNRFVVESGERGPQPDVLSPGTHPLNPYEFHVFPIDMRSHRFDMTGEDVVQFLSKDGFQIKMEATVEWSVDREKVTTLFVEYVDSRAFAKDANQGDEVIKCIVEKVLLPNARAFSRMEGAKHAARDFISGVTRQKFQTSVLDGLKREAAEQGIVIQSALVRKIEPPKEIADPIRQREIAIRQRERLTQEKAREIQQKSLAQAVKKQELMKLVKQAEADISVAVTAARRQSEVALIGAKRKLEVASLELEAARNQAAAIMSEGEAAADVVRLRNTAESSGIRAARSAFGDGDSYVRYLFLKKVAPAIRTVISNTDGPFVDI